MITAAGFSIF